MKPIDFAKAAGVAMIIMVVNVLISILVITVYSYSIAPGHDAAFYEAAAQRIAPWSSVVFGAPLCFVAAYHLGRRHPDRNATVFAAVFVGVYAVVDLAILFASGGLSSLLGIVVLSLTTKLIGALIGARLASR
jgi:hypothetical protein